MWCAFQALNLDLIVIYYCIFANQDDKYKSHQ